jgi:NAD-dependent dihydropyrimidine dehydrogenase PreA subunit
MTHSHFLYQLIPPSHHRASLLLSSVDCPLSTACDPNHVGRFTTIQPTEPKGDQRFYFLRVNVTHLTKRTLPSSGTDHCPLITDHCRLRDANHCCVPTPGSTISNGSTVSRCAASRDAGKDNMPLADARDRGLLRVNQDECKGCGLCIESCPKKVITLKDQLNHYGYRTAAYTGSGCTGCGICFLACPEPGAITVLRLSPALQGAAR